MGEAIAQIDYLEVVETLPEIKLQLLAKRLLYYVLTAMLFFGVFTTIAYVGISVETVYEPMDSSKKSEERVKAYNAYSGYVMAYVKMATGLYMSSFMPVLNVYIHNAFYFLQRKTTGTGQSQPAHKIARKTHRAILFAFPIVLAVFLGNSIRGFQAGQSSSGFQSIMTADDLKKEQPTLELIKHRNTGDATALASASNGTDVHETILRNAIRARSSPFMFNTKSPCRGSDNQTTSTGKAQDKSLRTVQINVHELDSTSAVYGFVPQEWNGEALTTALIPTSSFRVTYKDLLDASKAGKTLALPPDFSLTTAFEILVQGKLVVERAYGDAATDTYPCSLSDYVADSPARNTTANATTPPPKTTKPPTAVNAMNAEVRLPTALVRHLQDGLRRRRLQAEANHSSGSTAALEEDSVLDDGQNQWTYDERGIRQCEGAVSSLFDMFEFDEPNFHTTDNLVRHTASILNKTLGNLSIEETEITLEKYELTSQIYLEAVRIDIPIDVAMNYALAAECAASNKTANANASSACGPPTYLYGALSESFCGSDGCAFLDGSETMKMQREIGIVPYVVNCSLDAEHVHYSADFRGFYPTDCKKVPNTALLFGIGSFITGEEYGSNYTKPQSYGPYIVAPRRHLRLTFAKVTWQTEDLSKKFDAKCGNAKAQANCNGLWYQLQSSGRFLFAGNDALPTKKLAATDFRSPISLVQLNSPTLYVPQIELQVTLEPLTPGNFQSAKWDKKPFTAKAANGSTITTTAALHGNQCSMLIDSYLRQVTDNRYMVEQPLQTMYTAFFYYLMQNAAVAQLNNMTLALNAPLNQSATALTKSASGDRLGNVKLKGDMQVRSIRVSVPPSSFQTTFAGCVLMVVLTLLVVFVPARRVQYFSEGTSTAQEFMTIRSDKAYPDSVHKKTLLLPATSETVEFGELEIERMVLVHKTETDRKVYL
jgi:hypothetical protein